MDFVEEVAAVKKPALHLVDFLAEQYSAIAFKFGYFEAQSPCWLYFMRKDGDAAAFELQFGNVSEFKSSLARLVESRAQHCFLVTSSRAHALRLEQIRGLLLRNFEIGKSKFVLLDIETSRGLRVNFEWEDFQTRMDHEEKGQKLLPAPLFREQRRKRIFGRRGEHKEQD